MFQVTRVEPEPEPGNQAKVILGKNSRKSDPPRKPTKHPWPNILKNKTAGKLPPPENRNNNRNRQKHTEKTPENHTIP